MAKENKDSFAGATVELADKDTSFYDPATGLNLSRFGTAAIGDTVGAKTHTALLSGRLLVVGGKKAAKQSAGDGDDESAAKKAPAKGKKADAEETK